ncbi:MAG: leucine-rich repeat protein [Clostridia bacterium]|nr:leucine-rich repeat protein [Clostridia bacterium]
MDFLKRATSVVMSVLLLLAMLPIAASAETETGRLGSSNVYYELNDDGTLRLYGSGATPNYSGTNQSPFVEIGYINKIIVDEGVTKLGDYIFERCDVTEVSLPTSLRELGMFAFGGCEYLEEIELQKATKTFGIGVFYRCSSLKKITFLANTINCFKLYENENGFSFNSLLSPVENASVYIPLPITVNESFSSGTTTAVNTYEQAAAMFNKNGNTVYCVNDNATVKWKNYDGTVLETDTNATQGEIPTYEGATPEKPVDDNYGYVFSGWSPEPFAVLGDMSYTATFEAVDKTAYIDENGVTQYAGARTLTGTETELPGGWYLVDRDITYTNNLKFTGDVHIILADGATMNMLGTTNYSVLSDAGLSIYCQEGRTGALISDGIVATYVKICGGNVNIVNTVITAYDVDIYGGRVDVGTFIWSLGGNMNVYGGNISVSNYISVKNAVTIGYKNSTDSIYSKEYRISETGTGTQAITIADGQSFKNADDATEIFTGTADLDAVKEKTLVPYSYNTITYTSDEYGTVTGVSGANFGDEVTLTVSPNTGCYLDSLTVKDGNNNEITVTDGKFKMPDSAVTVTADFEIHTYTVNFVIDGVTVETDENVPYGDLPIFNGEITETYFDSDGMEYRFAGWSPEPAEVTDDITYTATYALSGRIRVNYLDEYQNTQTVIANILTGNETTLTEGWYFVKDNISYSGELKLLDSVNLILGNNSVMSTVRGITYAHSGSPWYLNVYAQSGQSGQPGTLNINDVSTFYSLKVCGGNVNFKSIMALNTSILGGRFTSTGIMAINDGEITLGCNTADSSITVDSYSGTVKIVDGQTLIDGNRAYRGTVSDNSKLSNKTLVAGVLEYDINEDDVEDINDIAFIIAASEGEVTMTASQSANADLNADGVIDAFDAAALDRIFYSSEIRDGDVNQDGDIDIADYAMIKSHISGVDSDESHPANLLDKAYLGNDYASFKDNYSDGVIITAQYYTADINKDRAVDAFDLFYLDKIINGVS